VGTYYPTVKRAGDDFDVDDEFDDDDGDDED
jgi:hypothetical protein